MERFVGGWELGGLGCYLGSRVREELSDKGAFPQTPAGSEGLWVKYAEGTGPEVELAWHDPERTRRPA